MTAVSSIVGRGRRVHLGIDRGALATKALCGCARPMRTSAILAANCGRCIALARKQGLNVEGLVAVPERLRQLINALRLREPRAANMTTTELAALLRSCRTVAGAARKLRALKG